MKAPGSRGRGPEDHTASVRARPAQGTCPLAVLLVTLALAGCAPASDRLRGGKVRTATEMVAPHPLDPLSKQEIETAAAVVNSSHPLSPTTLFPLISLNEPPKEEVLRHRPGAPMRREARVIVLDREANRSFEALVDLAGRRVLAWNEVRGGQPPADTSAFRP